MATDEPLIPTIIDNSDALMAITRAEVDTQIATAKAYPRSIQTFRDRATEYACLDEEVAGTMFYCMPRAGKQIEGPSVRLAEVVATTYGNIRVGARIVGVDAKFVTAQGFAHDLESNYMVTKEVKRRITNKEGRTLNDDMIQVISNAACSIAIRDAIFKVVPFAFVKPVYQRAQATAIGNATSTKQKRAKAVEWFKSVGASESQVLAFLGREGLDDLTEKDLVKLRGVVTAIKDGEITVEDALTPEGESGPKSRIVKKAKVPDSKKPDPEPTHDEAHLEAFDVCTSPESVDEAVKDMLSEGVPPEDEDFIRRAGETRKRQLSGKLFDDEPIQGERTYQD